MKNENRQPEPSVDFDYKQVSRLLHEQEEPELPTNQAVRMSAQLTIRLLDWAVVRTKHGRIDQVRTGRRTIVLLWILNPAAFEGVSLTKLASALKLSCASMSEHSAQFSRDFGVASHAQSHGWNRKRKVKQ